MGSLLQGSDPAALFIIRGSFSIRIIIMHLLGSAVIFSCVLCSIIGLVSARRVETLRSGRSCGGSSYCENPPNYPGNKIRNILRNRELRNQTFPQGTFDQMRKRSINLPKIETNKIDNSYKSSSKNGIYQNKNLND